MKRKVWGLISLLTLMMVSFQNCGQYVPSQATLNSDLQSKNSEDLKPLIQSRASVLCQQDSDCKAIGLGSRACGGAEDILIYSNSGADEQALLALVDDYNQLAKSDSADDVSVCSILEEPEVACVEHACVAK